MSPSPPPSQATPVPSPHVSSLPPPIQEQPGPTSPTSSAQPQVSPGEAKKNAKLQAKIAALESQIKEMEEKQKEVDGKLEYECIRYSVPETASFKARTNDPQAIVKAHIKLLHDYNEIRDISQGLIGIIAENRGVRVSDVYRDFDVGEGD